MEGGCVAGSLEGVVVGRQVGGEELLVATYHKVAKSLSPLASNQSNNQHCPFRHEYGPRPTLSITIDLNFTIIR